MFRRSLIAVCLCFTLIVSFAMGANATIPVKPTYVEAKVGMFYVENGGHLDLDHRWSHQSPPLYLDKDEDVQLEVNNNAQSEWERTTMHYEVYKQGISEADQLLAEGDVKATKSYKGSFKTVEPGWYYVRLSITVFSMFMPENGLARLGHLHDENEKTLNK